MDETRFLRGRPIVLNSSMDRLVQSIHGKPHQDAFTRFGGVENFIKRNIGSEERFKNLIRTYTYPDEIPWWERGEGGP
jgi:hypothetical protein